MLSGWSDEVVFMFQVKRSDRGLVVVVVLEVGVELLGV